MAGQLTRIAEALGFTPAPAVEALASRVEVAEANAELAEQRLRDGAPLTESVVDLERAIMGDPGWRRFATLTEQEFTAEGRRQLAAVCRLMSVANPLIKRGLALRAAYVWGSGVEITARANGQNDGEQDVQAVVAEWLAEDGNARAVTGAEACDRLEKALGTDGELFFVHFTKPLTGRVSARVILAGEIEEIICNPADRSEPWYYRRQWNESSYSPEGAPVTTRRERLYPDLAYRPRARPRRIGEVDIAWDAPVLHVAVNRPEGWQRGVPDAYAAVNWARAYKEFLEQWATLMKSLARFAWKLTAEGSQRTQARARLAAAPARDPGTGQAQDVGGTAMVPPGGALEAIPKTGATMDSESGRPLAAMVAAGLDVPVTMLLADPGQTGARAVAETLDQPTELVMGGRRELWTAVRRRQLQYVINAAVRAPRGPLKGTVRWDPDLDREMFDLAGDTDPTVDVVWPELDDTDVETLVKAIVGANGTATMPPELTLRLLLQALGVRDVEGIVAALVDDDGEFQWPTTAAGGSPQGDAARAGQDPAATGPGSMTPDDDTTDDEPDDDNPDDADQED